MAAVKSEAEAMGTSHPGLAVRRHAATYVADRGTTIHTE